MERCITRYFFLVICVLSGLNGLAQASYPDEELPRFSISALFDVHLTSGLFARHLDRETGTGFGFEGLYRLKPNAPVLAGLGAHWSVFDHYTIRYSGEYDGIFADYREKAASRLFRLGPEIRFEAPVDFLIKPYIQGSAGLHLFYTNTKIWDRDANELVETINAQRQGTLYYGGVIGFQYIPRFFYLRGDFRIGYFHNSSVEFMRFREDWVDDSGFPIDFFESKNAAVSLVTIQVALTFVF